MTSSFKARRPSARWRLGIRTGWLALALSLGVSSAARALEPVAANVAGLYVGSEAVVEGKVRETAVDGNVVSLFLGDNRNDVKVALILGLLSNFPENPEAYYAGRRIRVVGRLQKFRGEVQMLVRDPSNIQLASTIAPAALDAVPGAPVNPAEVDILRRRLQALEREVQELRGVAEVMGE